MVAVVGSSGKPLDPTTEYRARKLLKTGKAVIYRYRPVFAIRLTERKDGATHPMEYKTDTGAIHVGISVCNEYHEAVNEQRDLPEDESERIRERARYRCQRRNRLWHRRPGFNKDTKEEGWLAPSIRHKAEAMVELAVAYGEVLPITSYIFETGKFDTQELKAIEEGQPLPQGKDYQRGERYRTDTLRNAVFTRDGYTCQCCGRGVKEKAILHVHHVGFWKHDRTDRLSNLLTVCEQCHTSKNHKPGGRLYGLEPVTKTLKGAAFMNSVRWQIVEMLRACVGEEKVVTTNGAATKQARADLRVRKTHSNDAYCMGDLHPKHRAHFRHLKKVRRHNRVLEKFYDASYIDTRDGKVRKGARIGCNRTKRNIPRNNEQNERIYRGQKVKAGKRVIRRNSYDIRPGDIVSYKGKRYAVRGIKNNGKAVALGSCNPSVNSITLIRHTGGWMYAEG